MFAPDLSKEKALKFSRFNTDSLLSTASAHFIQLEDQRWRSAEHYFQAQMVANPELAERISNADSALSAYKLGNAWYRRKRSNWKSLRRVLMTRALYTKAMMYSEVKSFLLATGDQTLLETSMYDHYWGLGRDQRGENMLGRVWMDIRKKIVDDSVEDA